MKQFLTFLIALIFVIVACNEDEQVMAIDDYNTTTTEDKPFEVNFNTFPGDDDEPIGLMTRNLEEIYFSKSGSIEGNCTYINIINPKQSFYNIEYYQYDARLDKITQYINGSIVNNKGDAFFFSGYLNIYLPNEKIVGILFLNSGTGAFEGVNGSITINGSFQIKSGCCKMTGKGSISNYKI